MRGDRPLLMIFRGVVTAFTPHARGSTCPFFSPPNHPTVYPACAGIDLDSIRLDPGTGSLPRMRGDRPSYPKRNLGKGMFTPHARGSTLYIAARFFVVPVYPACAGIDPVCIRPSVPPGRLPRMRGDRPGVNLC